MADLDPARDPAEAPAPAEAAAPAAGSLPEDAMAVLAAARATAGAYGAGFEALRRLFAAEVGLARDALVHGLFYLLLAMVMVATAYGLFTALLVAGLRSFGAPWPLAIFLPLLLSLGLAWLGIRKAKATLRHADFEATRRQLKLGLPGLGPKADDPAEPAP